MIGIMAIVIVFALAGIVAGILFKAWEAGKLPSFLQAHVGLAQQVTEHHHLQAILMLTAPLAVPRLTSYDLLAIPVSGTLGLVENYFSGYAISGDNVASKTMN